MGELISAKNVPKMSPCTGWLGGWVAGQKFGWCCSDPKFRFHFAGCAPEHPAGTGVCPGGSVDLSVVSTVLTEIACSFSSAPLPNRFTCKRPVCTMAPITTASAPAFSSAFTPPMPLDACLEEAAVVMDVVASPTVLTVASGIEDKPYGLGRPPDFTRLARRAFATLSTGPPPSQHLQERGCVPDASPDRWAAAGPAR